ncbi:MAG TPA: serine/threonine-protein kinase, partial [Kofleriaceae bacterium]|nr:serine/threonine-protein kinase [Kofleriaceae bacterium]
MIQQDEGAPPPTSPTIEAYALRKPGAVREAQRSALDPAPAVDPTAPGDADGPDRAAGPRRSPPRRVAQFVLLDRLGAGGMGEVFAAFDEKLERKVAIKLVASHRGDDRAQERLLREAQALARLSHPNVVTVYEVDTLPEGGLFIAMEMVKGQTLLSWQRGTRAWRDLVAMYAAAGEGLAAAHRAGIVHRDFKPENVLVGDDGRVRVVDFGLAFAAGPEPGSPAAAVAAAARVAADRTEAIRDPDDPGLAAPPPAPALTAAGTVVGTPGYMAPEQFAGATPDARTDQHSFCVALYEALHGERPYADLAFLSDERPALRRTEPDLATYPRWLWDVMMRGLALDPAQRFASMEVLLAELTRSRERTRRRLATGAAMLGVVAALGLWSAALFRRDDPPCPPATGELT